MGKDNPTQDGASYEAPSEFVSWISKLINHAQGDILDDVELAVWGKLDKSVCDKLTSRIKRVIQDLSREIKQETKFYEIKKMSVIEYGEER